MESFAIADYLGEFNSITRRGKCKSCSKLVTWNRDRVASHKRTNCPSASAEDRKFFAKRKLQDVSFEDDSNDSFSTQQIPYQISKEDIDQAVGNFFYRTGISFRIADSPAWKHLISLLNANYAADMPSSKTLSGRLLDKQYDETRAKIGDILKDSEGLTLTSDGWTNVRGEHIVNFIVKAPSHQPFFFKSINTSGIPQSAPAIADAIVKVVEEAGPTKFSAIVTDNAPVMQAAWKEIEKKHPSISAFGCAAHGGNLLIKDIATLPANSKTISEAAKIIQFVNNHHLVNAKFEEKRKEAGVTRKLSTSVPTRWFTEYNSAKSLNDAKIVLKRLANENTDELENIQPKAKSARALNLMKSDDFWDRLQNLVEDLELPSKVIGKKIKLGFMFKKNSYMIFSHR